MQPASNHGALASGDEHLVHRAGAIEDHKAAGHGWHVYPAASRVMDTQVAAIRHRVPIVGRQVQQQGEGASHGRRAARTNRQPRLLVDVTPIRAANVVRNDLQLR